MTDQADIHYFVSYFSFCVFRVTPCLISKCRVLDVERASRYVSRDKTFFVIYCARFSSATNFLGGFRTNAAFCVSAAATQTIMTYPSTPHLVLNSVAKSAFATPVFAARSGVFALAAAMVLTSSAQAAPASKAAPAVKAAPTTSTRSYKKTLQKNTRLAQGTIAGTSETNTPAAVPNEPENPNRLEVPVGPEDGDATATPTPVIGTPAPEATRIPAPSVTTSPSTSLLAEEPIPTDLENRAIASVRVVGNRVVPSETILGQVVGTKTGGTLSSTQVEADKRRIDSLGFFAGVQQQVTPNLDDLDKVDVAFIVIENRAITAFEFQGNSARVKNEDLQGVLESKVGTVLNRNTINRDVEKLQGLYSDKGLAALVTESRQDADGKVIFVLQEAKVSKVALLGLKKTKEALLRSQIRTRPGDTFDQIAIRADLNRLFDTGFFEDLSYRIADDPTTPGTVIVNITVKEKRTGQFGVGLGFDNRSRITGFVSLADTNFRGSGKRLSSSVELGAQRTFEVGYGDSYAGKNHNSSYDYSLYNRLIYREPRSVSAIIGSPTTFQYQEKRSGLRYSSVKPLNKNRDTSLILGFRAENARLFQVSNQNLIPVDLPQTSSGSVVAASVGYISDKRDLRLDPSRGFRRQITLEQALPVGSSSRFTKLDIDVRRYFPLIGPPKNFAKGEIPLPRLVLASRLAYGKSFGSLPPFEQYFVGGTDTVRGYLSDEQFGDNQFYSNLELRLRLNKQFTPVLFFDAGKAYGGPFSSSATDELLYSVGVGIRVKTPLGPVRFDIANGRRGAKTHFGIGSTF